MNTSAQDDIKIFGRKIFTDIWKVKTQNKYLVNLEMAEIMGTPTTGDTGYDKAIQDQMEITYQTINTLVDWHKNGIPFSIVRIEDVNTIYNIVNSYIEAWQFNLSRSINIADAPVEDFITLDAFAQAIYPYATTTIKTKATTIEDWITGGKGNMPNRGNMTGGGTKVEIKERNPIAELFASSLRRRGD
jgi:hypothetical protein